MGKLNKGVRTCKRCRGPIHENSLYEYCASCYKTVEEIFDKIRGYLKEYPGATSYEMEQRLGIPARIINNFVIDGRLIEIPNEHLNIECLRCGSLLLSAYHKYCPTCENEIKKDILKAKESLSNINSNFDTKGKMHLKHYSKD